MISYSESLKLLWQWHCKKFEILKTKITNHPKYSQSWQSFCTRRFEYVRYLCGDTENYNFSHYFNEELSAKIQDKMNETWAESVKSLREYQCSKYLQSKLSGIMSKECNDYKLIEDILDSEITTKSSKSESSNCSYDKNKELTDRPPLNKESEDRLQKFLLASSPKCRSSSRECVESVSISIEKRHVLKYTSAKSNNSRSGSGLSADCRNFSISHHGSSIESQSNSRSNYKSSRNESQSISRSNSKSGHGSRIESRYNYKSSKNKSRSNSRSDYGSSLESRSISRYNSKSYHGSRIKSHSNYKSSRNQSRSISRSSSISDHVSRKGSRSNDKSSRNESPSISRSNSRSDHGSRVECRSNSRSNYKSSRNEARSISTSNSKSAHGSRIKSRSNSRSNYKSSRYESRSISRSSSISDHGSRKGSRSNYKSSRNESRPISTSNSKSAHGSRIKRRSNYKSSKNESRSNSRSDYESSLAQSRSISRSNSKSYHASKIKSQSNSRSKYKSSRYDSPSISRSNSRSDHGSRVESRSNSRSDYKSSRNQARSISRSKSKYDDGSRVESQSNHKSSRNEARSISRSNSMSDHGFRIESQSNFKSSRNESRSISRSSSGSCGSKKYYSHSSGNVESAIKASTSSSTSPTEIYQREDQRSLISNDAKYKDSAAYSSQGSENLSKRYKRSRKRKKRRHKTIMDRKMKTSKSSSGDEVKYSNELKSFHDVHSMLDDPSNLDALHHLKDLLVNKLEGKSRGLSGSSDSHFSIANSHTGTDLNEVTLTKPLYSPNIPPDVGPQLNTFKRKGLFIPLDELVPISPKKLRKFNTPAIVNDKTDIERESILEMETYATNMPNIATEKLLNSVPESSTDFSNTHHISSNDCFKFYVPVEKSHPSFVVKLLHILNALVSYKNEIGHLFSVVESVWISVRKKIAEDSSPIEIFNNMDVQLAFQLIQDKLRFHSDTCSEEMKNSKLKLCEDIDYIIQEITPKNNQQTLKFIYGLDINALTDIIRSLPVMQMKELIKMIVSYELKSDCAFESNQVSDECFAYMKTFNL